MSRNAAGRRGARRIHPGDGDEQVHAPSTQRARYSSFSKMHLSDLFQRRQRANGQTSADEANAPQSSTARNNNLSPHLAAPLAKDCAIDSVASGSPQMPSASNAAYLQPNNVRRRLSSIFGGKSPADSGMRRGSEHFFSGSLYGEAQEELDPLLTEIFAIPSHVEAFREALVDDEGQREPPALSSIWPSVGGALGKLGMGSVQGSRDQAAISPGEQEPEQSMTELLSEQASGKASSQDMGFERQASTHNGRRRRRSTSMRLQETLLKPTQTVNKHPRKVGRIAAASDFAPVHERTERRSRTGQRVTDTGAREGSLYKLVRFPLLITIFVTIAVEFLAYVLIRQLVNLNEYFVAWRGHKGTLRARLRRATKADEWRDIALELDNYLGYEAWKREDASGLYDWILVKKVMHSLKTMLQQKDAEGVMNVLDLCLRNNFAGTENFHLYSETFLGTKNLIESYLVVVEDALRFIKDTESITPQRKRTFYRSTQKNMGRSALCLSGGACFGYYHIGVVRALLDANLLPNIITGTSAGGLIAALACTRTNEELDRLLVPELADRITACEETIAVWGPRVYRTGARFDTVKWAEKCAFFTMGSLTFAEAFARTGKILNISVIPSDRHSPVKLLNHYTAPNCIIWSSLLASAAVPGIMNPVCLMQKTQTGEAIPWNWGHRFKDGSLRSDIPLQDLHSLFNVNYPIVSQVNPHVHLFFFAPKGMPGRPVAHRKGKGWRGGFVLSASEHVLKLHLSMNFKIIRDLELLPSILGQDWSSVFLQRFSGAVTIWPKTRAWDWVRILSDPDRKELARMIRVGASVTFPKLHMIENRVRLERALQEGRRENRRVLRKMQHPERRAMTDDNRQRAKATAEDEMEDSKRAYRSSGEHGSGAEYSGSGWPSAADGLTQSDTDGGGDDFFSTRPSSTNLASQGSNARREDQGQHLSSPDKHMRRIRRQLARGFSRMPDSNAGDSVPPTPAYDGDVATPSEADDHGRGQRYLNSAQATPDELGGHLPRHIRERSFGLENDDGPYGGQSGAHGQHAMHRRSANGVRSLHGHSSSLNDTVWAESGLLGSSMTDFAASDADAKDAATYTKDKQNGTLASGDFDVPPTNSGYANAESEDVLQDEQALAGLDDVTARIGGAGTHGKAPDSDGDGSSTSSSSSGAEYLSE